MWRNLLARTTLLSLALHSILFVPWKKPPLPVSSPPLQIEIRETPTAPPQAKSGGHGTRRGSHGKVLSTGELTPSWRPAPGSKSAAASASSDSPFLDEEWGSRGGDFREIEHDFQYQRLLLEVRGMLYFPPKLARRGVQGGVNARLFFSEDSRCDWTRSRVGGDNHYLKVYVLAILNKLCALESVRIAHFKPGQFADLSFLFSIDEQPLPEQNLLHSNVLSFRRSVQNSILEYNVGPLHGYFFSPFVNVDIGWITENWDKYVHGHDPLSEFKDP